EPPGAGVPGLRAEDKRRSEVQCSRLLRALRHLVPGGAAFPPWCSIRQRRCLPGVRITHLALLAQSGRDVRKLQPGGPALLSVREQMLKELPLHCEGWLANCSSESISPS